MPKRKVVLATFSNSSFFVPKKDWGGYFKKGYGSEYSKEEYLLTFEEVLYLIEKNKIAFSNRKSLTSDILKQKRAFNFERYAVYKDLRDKGHVVKSGLKYGATFRVYEKTTKTHAIFLVEPIKEHQKLIIQNLTAKVRVANTTNKKFLLAIVNCEGGVTYIKWEWIRF